MPSPQDASLSGSSSSRARWQFGLGSLLLLVMVLGPVLGLGLPLLFRILIEHPASPPPTVAPTFPRDYEAGIYYESAETPLD